jgi:uncharacterized membrane-anchored protein
MSAEVIIGESEGARLKPHRLRAAVLGEVHARPFTTIETPRRLLHFAFDTAGERAEADRTALLTFCMASGLAAPKPTDKHHRVVLGSNVLRWEQHSEFTTYTWERPCELLAGGVTPFHPLASSIAGQMTRVPQPGPLLVAADLHLVADSGGPIALERLFSRSSLAVAENADGTALYATDFQTDRSGFVRILVIDRGLGPERAGALVQRILELETYRTLALLGLPEAQRLAPSIGRIEKRLTELTEEMPRTQQLSDNEQLLAQLTALAAELEAGAAASLFRFGASRAYEEIVQQRLRTIGERPVTGFSTWSAFLARRMAPAMRTCATIEQRQESLSEKLARAANLLRTRVDVEVERQNRDLLRSMNERTRLQLRLQATIEGLSVAAISYYVVGLIGHLVKGVKDAGVTLPIPPDLVRPELVTPDLAMAVAVPVVVLLVWWVVRRIRRRHITASEK